VKSFFVSMSIGKSLRIAFSIAILIWGIDILKFYHVLL
jgi:hypothetical protein